MLLKTSKFEKGEKGGFKNRENKITFGPCQLLGSHKKQISYFVRIFIPEQIAESV